MRASIKPSVAPFALAFAICAALITALCWANVSTGTVQANEGLVRLDASAIQDRLYLLQGWQSAEGDEASSSKTLTLSSDSLESLALFCPTPAPSISVEGAEVGSQGNSRYLVVPLGVASDTDGDTEITVQVSGTTSFRGDVGDGVYVTSLNRALGYAAIVDVQCFFIVGVLLAVILQSLTLFMVKRTETYLIWLALLAYISLARSLSLTFDSSAASPLVGVLLLNYQYPPGISGLARAALMAVQVMLKNYLIVFAQFKLLEEFTEPGRVSRTPLIAMAWVACASAVGIVAVGADALPSQLITMAYFGIAYVLQARVMFLHFGADRHTQFVIAGFWGVTVALLCFRIAVALGLCVPGNTNLLTYPRTWELLAYVVGFDFIVSRRFAHKFIEADYYSEGLEALNRSLEEIIGAKTAELSESYAALKREQESRTKFVDAMIHDIKTPIFAITGYSDVLRETAPDLPAETRHFVDRIDENAEFICETIDKLLLFDRLDSGTTKDERSEFALGELVEDVAHSVAPQFEKKGAALTTDCPDRLVFFGSRFYLRHALLNVLDNAARYVDQGGKASVTVGREGDKAVIVIRNDGPAISPDLLPHIFERYRSSGKDGHAVCGLGLTTANMIARLHGGTLEATAGLGRGAEFTFRLPLVPLPETEGPSESAGAQ